jgi:hypothetical protein
MRRKITGKSYDAAFPTSPTIRGNRVSSIRMPRGFSFTANYLYPHPEEQREAMRLEGWATHAVLVPTLRDAACGRSSEFVNVFDCETCARQPRNFDSRAPLGTNEIESREGGQDSKTSQK